jgi:hypothetical protein
MAGEAIRMPLLRSFDARLGAMGYKHRSWQSFLFSVTQDEWLAAG